MARWFCNSNGTFLETNNYIITPTGGQGTNSSFVSSGTFTVGGTQFTLSAPPTTEVAARFATGTIDVDRINYVEDNGNQTPSAYEYRR